ncbi:hypothetical protein SAMN05421784_11536 [Xenorhabdus koppenhoeferi]|uniref:Uncharacterized protein n=1 Tax=Xenorhabdus koppenhoeferi TaxID=351659 RepID=A0A1I7HM56_9GAMM|nr:hypothetical protein SAMN05421784_11536 [Xenorhabdus koppenhoeferi]
MNVIDGEEIKRSGHLVIQDEEYNRLKHQNKSHKHFITAYFILLERLPEENNYYNSSNGEQGKIGNYRLCNSHAQAPIVATLPTRTTSRLSGLSG